MGTARNLSASSSKAKKAGGSGNTSDIRKTVLDNGARILTEVVSGVYSASIGIWVDVGSEDESPQINGVSHCLEHMLFKGTKNRNAEQIAQEIEDVGGSLGAATGKENTCFYGHVLGEQLYVAIDLLCDMLMNASLRAEDLELEKQVILEEIKMYDDDPEDFAHETLLLNIWPEHALSRPITGTHESVTNLSDKILKDHVKNYYTPEKLVISIAGSFDENSAIETFTRLFSKRKPGSKTKTSRVPKTKPFRLIKHKDIEQAHISIAAEGITATDPRRFPLAILDLCLGGNMSSRLFQEVREKRGLVYSINTFRESHRESGLFGVYAGASPRHVTEVLKLISQELKRVKKEGFTLREIDRAKTQLKSELLLGLESMRNRTARNAYSELFYNRQLSVDEICQDIDRVTPEDVQALAKDILVPDSLSMVIVGPKDGLKSLPKESPLNC
jgi:predicted Zn-dependent peptidase